MSKIPILLLAFNRVDHVSLAMKAIRNYRPDRLYLECDGPREKKKGEKQSVEETRRIMLDLIDWPCEVKTLFRNENLGCAKAVFGAISWFFEQEEYGIICEDDVILGQDFFTLCEDLLPRYADEDKIMQIAAQNHTRRKDIPNSYVYSNREDCWGWATWARAWKKMDFSMSVFPTLNTSFFTKKLGLFEGFMLKRVLSSGYEHLDTFSSWAYRWYLSILVNEGLVIKPGVNLAINIGTNGGEHYEAGDVDPFSDLIIEKMEWPLIYNDSLVLDDIQIRKESTVFFHMRMIGLRKKIKRTFHVKK